VTRASCPAWTSKNLDKRCSAVTNRSHAPKARVTNNAEPANAEPVNAGSLATRHRSHLLLLALIVGFAAVLRFFSLGALGFWTDEFCTLSAAHGWGLRLDHVPVNQIAPPLPVCTRLQDANSFFQIPGSMAREDAHPPLYFMLVRGWEQIFGDSEPAVRSLNVVFSLMAIVLLYFVAKDSVGSTTALVACLLMAVATPQIQLSQEARNYMPVLVFSLCAAGSIERLRRSPGKAWACLLGASLLEMMLTHYFAAGAAAGLVSYAIVALKRTARRLALLAAISAGAIYVLLWGRAILLQRTVMQSGTGWLVDQNPGHVQRRLIDLGRLPVRFFVEITDARYQTGIALIGLLLLMSLPILFYARRELRIWIAWLVAAVALVAIADFTRSTSQLNWIRYTIFATPPAYVLLAAGIERGRWKMLLPGIAVLLALLNLRGAYVPAWKTDFHTPLEFIQHQLGPDDALVILGHDPIADGIMYAACQHYLPTMPRTSAVLTAPPTPEVQARLRACPHTLIIDLWPDQFTGLPGYKVMDQNRIPYFADLVQGNFQ
jgi:uncharacterized membrane protein